MASISLQSLLDSNLRKLDLIVSESGNILDDERLVGLVHAALLRLRNWESDIWNHEKSTIVLLPELSYHTAEIVRARLKKLLEMTTLVEKSCATKEATDPDKLRYDILSLNSILDSENNMRA
jgi:hypothetical protein